MKTMALILSVVLLSACTNNTQQQVSDGNGSAGVTMVYLQDGTKCAVLVGYSKGAISCDFRGTK